MKGLVLVLISHGLKTGKVEDTKGDTIAYQVPKADLYLDCRGIREHDLPDHAKGGGSMKFQDAVLNNNAPTITSFQRIIEDSIPQIKTRRNGEKNPYDRPYVICTMCAHGIHRSVASKHLLAERLKKAGYTVEVR